MTASGADISRHYSVDDLGAQILAALEQEGKNLDALTVDDLAPVDAFHIRGRAATEELVSWARIESDHVLLDLGSGLGGTCRYLAAAVGCQVIGVDLTEAYCRLAEMLSGRVGLGDKTDFRQGDVLDLPFDDEQFDVVWTEHAQMNIADKDRFYSEAARVLKPGGLFVFHDVFAGGTGPIRFPVPWAAEDSISHLISVEDVGRILSRLNLQRVRWEDKTHESVAFFRTVVERLKNHGWLPLGLHLLMGDLAAEKFANMLANLEEDRVRVVQAVMQRPPNPGGVDRA